MNHCKDKKKHKWEKKYDMLEECTVCGKVKPFKKEFRKGRKYAKGAFGRPELLKEDK